MSTPTPSPEAAETPAPTTPDPEPTPSPEAAATPAPTTPELEATPSPVAPLDPVSPFGLCLTLCSQAGSVGKNTAVFRCGNRLLDQMSMQTTCDHRKVDSCNVRACRLL